MFDKTFFVIFAARMNKIISFGKILISVGSFFSKFSNICICFCNFWGSWLRMCFLIAFRVNAILKPSLSSKSLFTKLKYEFFELVKSFANAWAWLSFAL